MSSKPNDHFEDDSFEDEQPSRSKRSKRSKDAQQFSIDLDEDTAQGVYSNLAICAITKDEVVLDFVYLQPAIPKGKIRSRVILNPKNAKRLLQMLEIKIDEYEEKYGSISEDKTPGMKINFN